MEKPKREADVSPLVKLSDTILKSIEEETKPRARAAPPPRPTPTPTRPSPRPLREQRR